MQYITYFDFDDLVAKHDEVIRKSGGLIGVFNEDLLKGCLDFIRDDKYYPDFEAKITHLVFSIAKNHGFFDGNKRTAIVAGAYFLELNAYDQYIVDVFMRNMEGVVLLVAQNMLLKKQLKQIIGDLINYGEMTDDSKMIYVELLGGAGEVGK